MNLLKCVAPNLVATRATGSEPLKVVSKTGTIVRTFVHRDLPLTGLVTSEFDKDSSDTNVTSVSVRVMGPWDDAEGDPDRFYEDSTKRV